MFGKNISVQISANLCRKFVSAFLVLSFFTVTLTSSAGAADKRPRRAARPATKRTIVADIKLDSFAAESSAGTTKLSWRTSFEQNTVGFKIWREEGGQRQLVNEDLVAGSLFKVGNGILPAGEQYSFYDRTDSQIASYYLEAVDINARSFWFGPVFPAISYEKTATSEESETLSQMNSAAAGQREQIDRVEIQSVDAKSAFAEVSPSPSIEAVVTDPNALKIEIRSRGMYRVDANTLAEFGFPRAENGNWRLFSGGVEQPMSVNTDGSLEFFGRGIDTIQTDTNVYWLMSDSTSGQRITRVPQTYIQSARDSFYNVTAERKDKIYRVSSIINGARENWFGAVVNSTGSNQTLTLSDIATDSGTNATLGVDLQGLTNYPHQVSVVLNGFPIGQINFNLYDRTEWTASVPTAYLLEGANTITLKSLGGSSDINITEAVRIVYPRRLKAQNNRLEFSINSQQAVKLTNFTTAAVRVFDVTNPTQVVEYTPESRQEADGTYTVTMAGSTTPRVMIAQGQNLEFLSATPLIRNNPSDLRSTSNQAKFLIITPREFSKAFWQLRDLRRWQGMPTEIVDIEDIYDEFNYGIRSAEAIRSFLQYAKQNWTVKPDYVLFGGDATIDPKNYTGFGGKNSNRVPTLFIDTWNMETASDEMLADFNGDDLGEMALGRLPAATEAEVEAMVQRIINFSPMTITELNRRGVHFVSDAFIGYDFANGSRNVSSRMPTNVSVNYLDRTNQTSTFLRTEITNRINSGAAIVNYFGHASTGSWANGQIYLNTDAQNLVNQKRQPLMVMLSCLNGDFVEIQNDGLAEAVMKQRLGGAMAVWAASGWNTAQAQEYMARDFYQLVFSGMRLGDAARQAKATTDFIDQKRTYVFFGDPTLSLVTP